MKRIISLSCLLAGLLLATAAVQAQTYTIDWYKVAGGGGASTGGVFVVNGTIGQADAGTLTGGNFTLQGGFWGIIATVPTPGAPLLTITRSGGSVIISWPASAGDFILEQTPTLSGTPIHWTSIPASTYQTNGGTISLMVSPPVGNLCFRLRKP